MIFQILRKEEKDKAVFFESDEDFAAHLAWRIVVRKEKLSEIEGFEHLSDRLARVVEYPVGYNQFSFSAQEQERTR